MRLGRKSTFVQTIVVWFYVGTECRVADTALSRASLTARLAAPLSSLQKFRCDRHRYSRLLRPPDPLPQILAALRRIRPPRLLLAVLGHR